MKGKHYRIIWKTIEYGESECYATSKKQAKYMADNNLDDNFEKFDPCGDWEVDNITEIKEK